MESALTNYNQWSTLIPDQTKTELEQTRKQRILLGFLLGIQLSESSETQ